MDHCIIFRLPNNSKGLKWRWYVLMISLSWYLIHVVSSYTTTPSTVCGHVLKRSRVIWRWGRRYQLCSFFGSKSEDAESQVKLILGDDLSKGIQGLGSEQGYLTAAKKRAEEYARRKQEEEKEEGQEVAGRNAEQERATVNNYGPGDLSSWRGFSNDGFEASAGNDGEDGWEVKGGIILTLDSKKKSDSGAESQFSTDGKLLLFDDENGGKLIL